METPDLDWTDYCLHLSSVHPGNNVELLKDGEQSFPAILDAIEKARDCILLELYIFSDDSIGRRFSDALERKAREGVRVFVIYDAMGSITSSRSFFDRMAGAGIHVAEYHHLVPWKAHWNWFRRNHRKILLIDGKTGFIGGSNISEEDAPRSWGGRGWKDTQVKLEGPCLNEITALFWESWRRCFMPTPRLPERPGEIRAGSTPVSVVSSSGLRNRRSIRRSYKYAISRARNYIYITNAYFLPGRTIYRKLIRAANRGVRVVIITPSQTDHPYVRWASWSLYGILLKSGIEIHEWQQSVLHSKTAVIDGVWASVGSHNLDHRSLHYNLEINVNIFGSDFGGRMKQMFEEDLKNSRRVTMEDCAGQGFLSKAAGRVLYWLRYWL